MSERNTVMYLEDILEAMNSISEYIGENNYEQFRRNRMMVDAVVRNIEVIGEASKNIPDEVRKMNGDIPWRKMVALRNIITHDYFGIDYDTIWEIVSRNIPSTKDDIVDLINRLKK